MFDMKKTGNPVALLIVAAVTAYGLTGTAKGAALVLGSVVLSLLLACITGKGLKKSLSGSALTVATVMLFSGFLAVCAMLVSTFFPGMFTANEKTVVCVALVSGALGSFLLKTKKNCTIHKFSGAANTVTVALVVAVFLGTVAVAAVRVLILDKAGIAYLALPASSLAALAAAGLTAALFSKADKTTEGLLTAAVLLCAPAVCVAAGYTEAGISVLLGATKGVYYGCVLAISLYLTGGVACRVEQFSLPSFMKGLVCPLTAAGILAMVYAAF